VLCYFESDWSKLYDLHPIFYGPLSTLLHPVLTSSYLLCQDFSKRASFPIVCAVWFYEKAVWGVVKSWEFGGNLRCSNILRIRKKIPMKWVLSISRNYWVYLYITLQSFKIWEFLGEFWGIETFYRSKFSPATGVRSENSEEKSEKSRLFTRASLAPATGVGVTLSLKNSDKTKKSGGRQWQGKPRLLI